MIEPPTNQACAARQLRPGACFPSCFILPGSFRQMSGSFGVLLVNLDQGSITNLVIPVYVDHMSMSRVDPGILSGGSAARPYGIKKFRSYLYRLAPPPARVARQFLPLIVYHPLAPPTPALLPTLGVPLGVQGRALCCWRHPRQLSLPSQVGMGPLGVCCMAGQPVYLIRVSSPHLWPKPSWKAGRRAQQGGHPAYVHHIRRGRTAASAIGHLRARALRAARPAPPLCPAGWCRCAPS